CVSGKCQQPGQDRADQTDGIGFKNVRSHARAITYVVADIICDYRRVARIVFFEPFLDLAHQVGANVGGFCVNAAAQSRENANETATQRKSNQAAYRGVVTDQLYRDRVEDRYREQRQPNYEQTSYRAAVEAHAQRVESPNGGGLRCPHIGQHGYAHTDEPSRQRTGSADDKPDGRGAILENEEKNENDHRDDADRLDLPVQIRLGTFLYSARDFPHPFV